MNEYSPLGALQELVAEITDKAERMRHLLVRSLHVEVPGPRDVEDILSAIGEYDNLVREA